MTECRRCLVVVLALLLASCGGDVRDGPPPRKVDVSQIADAVPRREPVTRAGNKSPYQVLGETYHVLSPDESRGYRARGLASWYGTKFHGRTTSNGETYDMYAMTAAHKTLPIPSYVRVTNLDNGRRVIVRINDRGPFHEDRIIDLSWAAARKLGVEQRGTAPVEVVLIDPADYQRNSVEAPSVDNAPLGEGRAFLQVGAFSSADAAQSYRQRVLDSLDYQVSVQRREESGRTLFKVLVGPFDDRGRMLAVKDRLRRERDLTSFVVYH